MAVKNTKRKRFYQLIAVIGFASFGLQVSAQVTIQWAVNIGPQNTVQTVSPALSITGDTVYFASGLEEVLYAFNTADGSTLWKFPYDGRSLSNEAKALAATPSKIWVCSHRANTYEGVTSANIPENSVEAIQKAIEKGTDMVEIDIRTTSDGHFVLMHDATVNRTTNGTGNVRDKTLAQIKTLKMKAANGTLTNCTVPTLEEALLAGNGKVFYNLDVEDKANDLHKMVLLADALHMLDKVTFYTGSDKESAAAVTSANNRALVFPWVSSTSDVNYYVANTHICMVQLNYSSSALISYARGKQLVSFSNALNDIDAAVLNNNFTEIDKMKSVQLQIIQTDYVELIKNYLNK